MLILFSILVKFVFDFLGFSSMPVLDILCVFSCPKHMFSQPLDLFVHLINSI